MVPSYLIPRTPDQLAAFAQSERYLLTTMVIIASRHDTSKSMRQVHDQSWSVMRVGLALSYEDLDGTDEVGMASRYSVPRRTANRRSRRVTATISGESTPRSSQDRPTTDRAR